MLDGANPMKVPVDRTLNRSGLSEVSWPIIGGGFAVGLLCGAVWLMSERGASSAETAHTEPPATDQSLDVRIENERLKHQLEVARLEARIAELERQLALSRAAATTVSEPVAAAPAPVPSSRPAPVGGSTTVRPRTAPRTPQQPTGRATLNYWNRMNSVIAREAIMRTAPAGGVTASNAGSFLDRRIAAGEYAATELAKLDTTGVDPEVVALAGEVAAWYRDGVTVCRTGKDLFSGRNSGPDMRAATEQYKASEKAHAAAVNGVNARGKEVRDAMSRKYSLTFPPLN